LWVLRVQRVRWVGGYGRMDSATGEDYAAAAADPVSPHADGAIVHLNNDHADALVAMAQAFGGYPDTTAATCTGADRYGLAIDELRSATVELTHRARQA
jgi:heme iron utilization protein